MEKIMAMDKQQNRNNDEQRNPALILNSNFGVNT
jgi:hypothetical protein